MKLILSRKGFDSESGGCASPIFPNDRLFSLPIPDALSTKTYREIGGHGVGIPGSDVATVAEQLSRGRVLPSALAHLDPDLDANSIARKPGWRPAFGQAQAAQGHLRNERVGVGDVFLFYGWFRRITFISGRWQFVTDAPDIHVIFGWLQVGEVLDVRPGTEESVLERMSWLGNHPHLHVPSGMLIGRNVIYVASERLRLDGVSCEVQGGGICSTFSERRILTDPQARKRSQWRLPKWFQATDTRTPLSYHADPKRWTDNGDHVSVDVVGRGQEFVLDCAQRPEAARWIAELLADGAPH